MGVIFGLIAAFCWGLGDYLITALTRRVGTAQALVFIQIMSLLAWICLLMTHVGVPHVGLNVWVFALGAGICHVLGLLLSYRAFEIGTLSLVSPIASGFAVVTAVLALSSGEHPPLPALGGAALLFVGVILATRSTGHHDEPAQAEPNLTSADETTTTPKATIKGVPEALGCALAFGIMFWMMKGVETQLGTTWALIVLKTMASGYALIAFALQQKQAQPLTALEVGVTLPIEDVPSGEAPTVEAEVVTHKSYVVWLLALSVAVVDTTAWLAFNAGISTAFTTIVTALASLFSVVTILLAWLLLRERLAKNQWIGVLIILIGVLIVSVYGG
ncbi:MAG: DMT family transporter [Abitibacteriaceae bacterium]|nr:DMT family transporter [Abditibacteriaceae bacterium]